MRVDLGMDRKGFLRNLFGAAASIAVAPTVQRLLLSAPIIESAPKLVAMGSGTLLSDLNLLTPYFYKQMVAKYGDERSFQMLLQHMNEI
jgi:hypothetical protein